MKQILQFLRSAVPSKKPTISQLELGELSMNTYDGKLFMKKSGSSGESIVSFLSYEELSGSINTKPNFSGSQYFIPVASSSGSLVDSLFFQSGSFTSLSGSLTVVGGITGSLAGSSSYAQSASYTLNGVTLDTAQTITGVKTFRGSTTNEAPILGPNLLSSTGWATDVPGWTGDYTNGWVVVGEGSYPMTNTYAAVANTFYVISITATISSECYITGDFGGHFFVLQFQGSGSVTSSQEFISTSTDSLNIFVGLAAYTFNGTITEISIKQKISTTNPVVSFTNSSGNNPIPIRTDNNDSNIFIGENSGYNNYSAIRNVGLGSKALQSLNMGGYNVAVGYNTLSNNRDGYLNVAIGSYSLAEVYRGSLNVAIGGNAMRYANGASSCVAIGTSALESLTGAANVAVGDSALRGIGDGSGNVAIGNSSCGVVSSGNNNCGIGIFSLYGIRTGEYNIGIGNEAGSYAAGGGSNSSGNNSIFIGRLTKPLTNSETNQIVIGDQATGLGSNTTTIGNSSTILTALYGSVILGGTYINSAAQLQIDSNTRGVLFPRMTTTQKNNISNPPAGLVIYDTTLGKLCVRTASAWETITSA